MKYLSGYTDPFLSPVTGRLPSENSLPDLCPGLVWQGDIFGRPRSSTALLDVKIDLNFLKGYVQHIDHDLQEVKNLSFILQTPSDLLPKAQALSDLDDGIVKNVSGILTTALPDIDYMSSTLPSGHLWIGDDGNTAKPQQTITIDNLPTLSADTPLTGEIWRGTMSGRPEVSNALTLAEADIVLINARFVSSHFVLNSGNAVLQAAMPNSQFLTNVTSGLPVQVSDTGQIEVASLPQDYLWIGDPQGRVASQPNISLSNLPDLMSGMVWRGDAQNRVEAVRVPSYDLPFILKSQGNPELPNAQALDTLGIGITKTTLDGALALAVAGTDYSTPASVDAQLIEFDTTVVAPEIATAIASIEATLSYVIFPFLTIMPPPLNIGSVVTATSASLSLLSADVATISNELIIDGDITGSCSLRTGLSTTLSATFSPNPVLPGHEGVVLPKGTSSQRPSVPIAGMFRYNTSPN